MHFYIDENFFCGPVILSGTVVPLAEQDDTVSSLNILSSVLYCA